MIIDRSKQIKRNRKRSNPCKCLTKICRVKWIASVRQLFSKNCKDFCNLTSLHGFRYIFEKTDDKEPPNFRKIRQTISFILWTAIVLVGIVLALYLMRLVWNKYQSTPTITTIETDVYPIWNIPFPGVTICNVNTVYMPGTKNLTAILLLRGIQKNRIQTFFANLAKLINYRYVDSQYAQIFSILEEYGYTTEKLMYELMHPCNELVRFCEWLGKPVPCKKIIRTVKSAMGFCCSFNYKLRLPPIKNGPRNTNNNTSDQIIHVSGAGEDVGLFALLDVQPENYISPRKAFYAADIIIHNPEEYPESQLTAIAQPGNEIVIAVDPSVLYTDKDVESLSIKSRSCRFDSESQLKTTQAYSFQSCMTECRAKTIIQKCSCLPFFYYNELNTTRQCTLHDAKCLSANKRIYDYYGFFVYLFENSLLIDIFASWEPPSNIRILFNTTKDIGMSCDCYPNCAEERYEAAIYKVNVKDIAKTQEVDTNNSRLTVVKVYFRSLTCLRYRRQMYLTWDGVLASLGGVFGICLGGSVVSLIELVYFLTFKMFDLFNEPRNKEPAAKNNYNTGKLFTVQQSKQLRFMYKK